MLPTLKLKLVLAFGAAVFITVILTAAGSFYLLRQEQTRTERERVGLLVLHTYAEVVALAQLGASPDDLRQYLADAAAERKVRFLLVDAQNRVAVDTQNELVGQNFDPSLRRLRFNDSTRGFSIATVEDGPERQTIFSPVYGTRTVPVPVRRQYDLYLFVPESNITGAWGALIPKLIWPSMLALFVSGVIAYLLSLSLIHI